MNASYHERRSSPALRPNEAFPFGPFPTLDHSRVRGTIRNAIGDHRFSCFLQVATLSSLSFFPNVSPFSHTIQHGSRRPSTERHPRRGSRSPELPQVPPLINHHHHILPLNPHNRPLALLLLLPRRPPSSRPPDQRSMHDRRFLLHNGPRPRDHLRADPQTGRAILPRITPRGQGDDSYEEQPIFSGL